MATIISDSLIKINQLLVLLDDAKDDEEKNVFSDGQTQNKSSSPPPSVTFNFVGIRPTKLHLQNNQISKMVLGPSSTKITFNNLSLDDPVSKLKDLIKQEFEIPIKRSILVMYGHIKLIKDNLLLNDYGITDNSCFIIAIYDGKNHDAITVDNNNQASHQYNIDEKQSRNQRESIRRLRDMDAVKRRLERIRQLKANPKSHNTLQTTLSNLKIDIICGLDIITMENDINCMKLPSCGHILSKNSLYQYALSSFKDRNQILKCPHMCCVSNKLCNQQWDYPVIKQYLLSGQLMDIEYDLLELLSARNVIEIDYELQKCISCRSLLYRNHSDNNFNCFTLCPLCINPNISFCWGCNTKWNNDHICDTKFKAQIMEIISSCCVKTVGNVANVPSIRCCPKCNQLIHHVAACKHMKCSFCKTSFCFVCLKPKANNKWQCGDYSKVCPIAKRQNYQLLPKLNQSFELFS